MRGLDRDEGAHRLDEVLVLAVDIERWESASRRVGRDEADVGERAEEVGPKGGDVSYARRGEEVLLKQRVAMISLNDRAYQPADTEEQLHTVSQKFLCAAYPPPTFEHSV